MNTPTSIAILSLGAALLSGCTSTTVSTTTTSQSSSAAVAAAADTDYFTTGRLTFAGQPSKAQFEALAGTNSIVVNCRTQTEVDRLAFDQVGLLDSAGVDYHHIPMGGAEGYSPADVDAFAELMRTHDGPILLHCGSGGRVRMLYAAYLIRYQNFTPDQAMDEIAALGQSPSTLERLLGEELSLQHTGRPLAE